ncbi:glycosyltransferase family 4 protein [Streptomyces sp. 8K308]|uniref:glycosyltransferase family 4 protein n=1 Tax=Streptomyces sp. 8K308 TaxID=2530388 RepID=UPI0014052CDC|nr:glycosyltransferase family 4 protein [Streptomyces sp. 8K308]
MLICADDVRGRWLATGGEKPVRESGLVEHTHQLLAGLVRRHPGTRVTVAYTGAAEPGPPAELLIPEGVRVRALPIATQFPEFLNDRSDRTCPIRTHRCYEGAVDQPDNALWRSLAEQYAKAVKEAGATHVVAQNIDPVVALVKAREMGLVCADLRVTGLIHDAVDTGRRFGFLARRVLGSASGVRLIAGSGSVCRALLSSGVPESAISTVINGMDAGRFRSLVARARAAGAFRRVRERNGLDPRHGVILVPGRRVPGRGHEDVIRAAEVLVRRGRLRNACVAITGAGLVDPRWPAYQDHLARLIREAGVRDHVHLLGPLSRLEMAACYGSCDLVVHAPRMPGPLGYSLIEAMLAGAPVITTAQGGAREVIDHGRNGLLVPPGRPPALAEAVETALTNRELHNRLAVAGRATAGRLTQDAMLDGYEAALTRAVRTRAGRGRTGAR